MVTRRRNGGRCPPAASGLWPLPRVTAFSVPAQVVTHVVAVSAFTGTSDLASINGYLITESAVRPLASDPGWSGTAPTTFTVAGGGLRTLFAWVRDIYGFVSRAATAQTYVPAPTVIDASDVSVARAVSLRAIARGRVTVFSTPMFKSGAWHGESSFSEDVFFQALPFSGYFTSGVLRPIVDAYLTSIGGDVRRLTAPASSAWADAPDYWRYDNGAPNNFAPNMDAAAFLALLASLVYDRGDTTVYAAVHAACAADMEALPKDGSGRVAQYGGGNAVGFQYQDPITLTGGLLAPTVINAWAYRELARMATAEGDAANAATYSARSASLIDAARTLRQPSGWYYASTTESKEDVWITALIASEALCTAEEAAETGGAIAAAYQAGTITLNGALRLLISPTYWTTSSVGQGAGQNGGRFLGPWVGWAARAMERAGAGALGLQLLDEYRDEIIRQQAAGAYDAPWETISEAGTTYAGTLYAPAGGAFAVIDDAGAVTTPVLTSSGIARADDFSVNDLSPYVSVGGGTWGINTVGGRLESGFGPDSAALVASGFSEADQVVAFYGWWSIGIGAVLRYADDNNFTVVRFYNTGGGIYSIGAYEKTGGAWSGLVSSAPGGATEQPVTGSITPGGTPVTPFVATIVGGTLTAVLNGEVFTWTATRLGAGTAGPSIHNGGAGHFRKLLVGAHGTIQPPPAGVAAFYGANGGYVAGEPGWQMALADAPTDLRRPDGSLLLAVPHGQRWSY